MADKLQRRIKAALEREGNPTEIDPRVLIGRVQGADESDLARVREILNTLGVHCVNSAQEPAVAGLGAQTVAAESRGTAENSLHTAGPPTAILELDLPIAEPNSSQAQTDDNEGDSADVAERSPEPDFVPRYREDGEFDGWDPARKNATFSPRWAFYLLLLLAIAALVVSFILSGK